MAVYYYQQIYARAKDIFFAIPWPDNPFFVVSSTIGGNDERGRLLRETLFRYLLATTFMVFHGCSAKFQQTYHDPFESLVKLGLLTEGEVMQIERRCQEFPYITEVSLVPLAWGMNIIQVAYKEDRIGEIFPMNARCAHTLFCSPMFVCVVQYMISLACPILTFSSLFSTL
jgi:hypothetical protein